MFESALCQIIFYVFALLALISGLSVVCSRNPVNSAMSMALCFAFVAAIFFGLGAQFLGIVQIIVYAGAILVLFLFVIMMLDIKAEENRSHSCLASVSGVIIGSVFAGMVCSISIQLPGAESALKSDESIWSCFCCSETSAEAKDAAAPTAARFGGELPALNPAAAAHALNPELTPAQCATATDYPDVKLIGHSLFTQYNIPFVILGFALLSGSVGAMALARKYRKD